MNSNVKTALFWVVIICFVTVTWAFLTKRNSLKEDEISFTVFLNQVQEERIRRVRIAGQELYGEYRDTYNLTFKTLIPSNYPALFDTLQKHKVEVEIKVIDSIQWVSILVSAIPFLLLLIFWIFMVRQMQSGGKAMQFGKSRAKLHDRQQKRIKFDDVAGAGEAKVAMEELVEFLRDPTRWHKIGAKAPKGCLLVGPPGCGKTLIARALAGEANVPFFSISGAEFVEMFVGVGAARVRDLFEQGKKNAPCVIFIDEIDAVGRKRGSGVGGGNDEREQTLNQLLVEMDGFENSEGVIVVAATNRADVLDRALIRPGRFDRQIFVPLPDAADRKEILKIHVRFRPLAEDVDLGLLAHQTPGYGGADLANLANEAAIQTVRRMNRDEGLQLVTMQDFKLALDLIRSGRQIFSNLDLVLIESATQLAQPMERLFVRLSLTDGQKVEGELLWADSAFVKYRSAADAREIILPKHGVWKFEALNDI